MRRKAGTEIPTRIQIGRFSQSRHFRETHHYIPIITRKAAPKPSIRGLPHRCATGAIAWAFANMLLLARIQTIWVIECSVEDFPCNRNFHAHNCLCTLLPQPQHQKVDLGGCRRMHTISAIMAIIWLSVDFLFWLCPNPQPNPRNCADTWLRSYGILDDHYLASV